MLKRTLSGAVYVAIIVGFFLLREFVHFYIFALLPWLFAIIGSIEMTNALKGKIDKGEYFLSIFLGITLIPLYALLSYVLKLVNYAFTISLGYVLLILVLCLIVTSIRNKKGLNGKGVENDFKTFFYPNVALLFMVECSSSLQSKKSLIALLLIFVICALTDTLAYLVGMLYNKIRKGNAKKLCPKISPKKTVAGAIGGLIGGVIGAILVAVIFKTTVTFFCPKNSILIFAIIGLLGAVSAQAGDLFESYIKRSLNIKDMGNIMPGHGGVMDRIDGILFTTILVYVAFIFI